MITHFGRSLKRSSASMEARSMTHTPSGRRPMLAGAQSDGLMAWLLCHTVRSPRWSMVCSEPTRDRLRRATEGSPPQPA
jgi:hypothetical protein